MSFSAVEIKNASVSSTAVTIGTTTFGFASTNLTGAQKAIISPTSASLRVSWDGTAPTTSLGIYVSSGTNYEVFGTASVANLQLVCATSASTANVVVQILK